MSDAPTFRYHDVELEYFFHLYNLTHLNERMVELAVALSWLQGRDERAGIEIGNVTGHYRRMHHDVLDLHEEASWYQHLAHQRVINVDLLHYKSPVLYPWVMSLSTIEHTAAPDEAIKALKSLVAPGGQLLVSFPTGVSNVLDEMVDSGLSDFRRACTLVRDFDPRYWVQTPRPVVREYGPWANSVVICEWTND